MMTYSITYSRGAYTWSLNGFDATSGLTMYYLGDAGHGLTPFHLLTQRGAYQQGETTVDYRKDPRVITLPLLIRAETLETQAHVRDTLIRMFKPSNVPGTLTIVNGAYTRAITVRTVGGLQYENPEGAGYDVKTVVQLRADDPTWCDPTPVTFIATPTVAGTPTVVPFVVPFTFGTSTISTTSLITYNGSAETYPIITAVGPITGLTITNNTTGDIIAFTGSIAAGRTYTINLQYGYKTVIDDLGANRYGEVTAASTLATWNISADPEAPGGVNTITIAGTGATSTSAVTLQYYTRYDGI